MTEGAGATEEDEEELPYALPDVRGQDWNSEEYRITLPEILKGEELGDETHVKLELREEETPSYIHGKKSEKLGTPMEGYYSIKDNRLKIPQRWRTIFVDQLNYVAMEFYLEDEPHFRIYDFMDFSLKRVPAHDKQGITLKQLKPVALPAIWKSLEKEPGPLNLASLTPYSGQQFRIIPFDANNQIFQENVPDLVAQSLKPKHLLEEDIVERDQIPRFQPNKLTIEWSPSGRVSNNKYPIFSTESPGEIEIILPKQGRFSFSATTEVGTQLTKIEYSGDVEADNQRRTIINGWKGIGIEETHDGNIDIYVPCVTIS